MKNEMGVSGALPNGADSAHKDTHHTTGQKTRHLDVYIMPHCGNCDYARSVAENIAATYRHVQVSVIALDTPNVTIPESVFAVPTYLVDGRVWSLGNPSAEKIRETFGDEENAIGQQTG